MSAAELQQASPRTLNTPFWCLVLGAVLVLTVAHFQTEYEHRERHPVVFSLDLATHPLGSLVRFVDQDVTALVPRSQLQALASELDSEWQAELQTRQAEYEQTLRALLEERLDASFAAMRTQVDVLADWNYSTSTSYALLYELGKDVAGAGDIDAYVATVIQEILFEGSGLETLLQEDLQAVSELYASSVAGLESELGNQVRTGVVSTANFSNRSMAQSISIVDGEQLDWQGVRSTVLQGVFEQPLSTGIASALVARALYRVPQNAVLRQVTRASLQRAGARAAARSASAGAGGSAAAAGAVVCGPLAVICAPVAGLTVFGATWLGTDYLISRGDEFLNRDRFVSELEREIAAVRAQVEETILANYANAFAESGRDIANAYQQALTGNQTADEASTRRTMVPREQW